MSIIFWISSSINNTVPHFLSITLIKKIISLSENLFISFTTAKMLLINFISQTSSFLNLMLILVQFLIVNVTISVQILSKSYSDSASTRTLIRFLLLQQETTSTKFCSDWFCSHLALPHLTSPHLAPPHLVAYLIIKSLIMPHHIKMHLVL